MAALIGCTTATINAQPAAFPGAEGFGKFTTGGRGGSVAIVNNLEDDGPGSLRAALNTKGAKMVVFAVSGTIHLQSKLVIPANTTIAGQSAPGDGICIADYPVLLGGNNIIVRYLRVRMGDRYQNKGMVDGAGSDDALGGTRRSNIIVDHCSISWSTDEVFSVYAGDSTTLQWNIISEPLNYSYHFEKGDKDFEHHGYGAIWGGKHLSAHHNLFAHCNSRTPRFDGIRNAPEENVDYRNNVIYNWGGNNIYAGEGGTYNLVNNYYKYGPSTSNKIKYQILNPYDKAPQIPFGKFYLDGNYIDGSAEVTRNNWIGVRVGNNSNTEVPVSQVKLDNPFVAIAIPAQTAAQAYDDILSRGGAILPARDTLDARIVLDVKNRTGRFIDVQGGYPHGTPYEQTVNAWPLLKSKPALKDADNDGMPDEWEKKHGLNPNDPSDAAAYKLDKEYTNIEVYLNSLVK